ncbi:MAG TPA: hypothetical protein VJ549_00455, partial [Geothrix sp.]|nr:hypothetical protein [Geothrix sp.]
MSQKLFPSGFQGVQHALHEPRKAALLLHAMSPQDQRWILGRLPVSQANGLQELLDELDGLGIPRDRLLLDEVVAMPPRLMPLGALTLEGKAGQEDALIQALAGADPGLLVSVLGGEPAGLIAQVLEICDWPWREGFLRQLPAAPREEVLSRLSLLDEAAHPQDPNTGAALRLALLTGLRTRLTHLSMEPPGGSSHASQGGSSKTTG